MLTGNELSVLCRLYSQDIAYEDFVKGSSWEFNAVKGLIEHELVEYTDLVKVTGRGKVFVKHIKNLPLPTLYQRWEMP